MQQQQAHTIPGAVAGLGVDSRARFIARTYVHLLGAMALFVLAEYFLFSTDAAATILNFATRTSWLLILGGFMLVGWLATRAAHTSASKPVQYLALVGFVLAEAIIFAPLIYIIEGAAGGGVIGSAAAVTLVAFAALTGVVFITRKDFSFLGAILRWAGVVALLLIVAGVVFGFQLGTFFSVGMVAFAGAAILYDTSNILHHYPEDRYVGAALELFASIALLFWYVLRLFSRN